MTWTERDLKTVTFVTLGNGLWPGFLSWLVLGLWLDMIGFVPCWLGATVVSWFLAIQRQYRAIEVREEMPSQEESEG
jgi:hypothetical protein